MSDYQFNPTDAAAADNFHSRIEEKGQYLGMFTRAEAVVSDKGTKGIDFSFKAKSGETADYLSIWTNKKDGTKLPGFSLVMAIMACLKVQSLTSSTGVVEKWNKDQQQKVKETVNIYSELMNKPIGLLIYMEENSYNGKMNWRPVIAAPYNEQGYTASEIVKRSKDATTLPKMLAALRDKTLKTGVAKQPATDGGFDQSENPGAGLEDFQF